MTIEYVRNLLVKHEPAELIAAYEEAREHLDAATECLGYELTQCDEEPRSFILRIEWASAAARMHGYRHSPHFPLFLAAVRSLVPEIAEMRHYEVRIEAR